MKTRYFALTMGLVLALAGNAAAQSPAPQDDEGANAKASGGKPAASSLVKQIKIENIRPYDQRGINVFESPKAAVSMFSGFKFDFGAAFTQQFQSLSHENTAAVVNKVDAAGKTYNSNQLMEIGNGFNNAVANAYADVQLAPGIRVALTAYLSSRHHQETWVKDGYIQIDASPIDVAPLHELMKYVTLKVGHFEVNYGDAHFRRSDNGNALYNPFIGNTLMDPFTTEIGAEAYVRKGPFLAMLGTTAGESSGKVTTPDQRSMTLIAKVGFDKQFNDLVRVRLTGSRYQTDKSTSAVLYQGDRAGSRYYMVMENVIATTTAQYWSGNLNPGFKNQLQATMINPFVKIGDAELFGTIEFAKGKETAEPEKREASQIAVDGVYRLLDDRLFVGARYNTAKAELKGYTDEVSIDRTQFGGGWFITPSLVMKAEYVTQKYNDFPATDIRNGGKFNGLVVEGVVSF
jgi:hypothetical protein